MNNLPEIPVPIAPESLTKLSPEFAVSLIKATASIEGAVKASVNPHFKSRYADLAAVIEAVRQPLTDNGLTFIQRIHKATGACIETILVFKTGEMLSFGIVEIPIAQNGAQGYGSALSYARRYSLATSLGVPQVDDDANEATAKPPTKRAEPPTTPEPIAKAFPGSTIEPVKKWHYCTDSVGLDKIDELNSWFERHGATYNDELRLWESETELKQAAKFIIGEQDAMKRAVLDIELASDTPKWLGDEPKQLVTDDVAAAKLKNIKTKVA